MNSLGKMRVSNRMELVKYSETIDVMEKIEKLAKAGKSIQRLDIGDPGFETPKHIAKTAYEAMKEGFTHYTSSMGVLELRETISADLKKRGIEANPKDEIVVTPGSKHAIFCACFATLDHSDEVLVFSPTWPTHYAIVQAVGAKPIEVPTKENYRLDEETLKRKITDRSRMIIINSPNNPSGGALEGDDVKLLADIAEDSDLLVLSDEIYDRIIYDSFKPISIASVGNMNERTITINGFSKTYAMAGWRLGYAAASKEIIGAMVRLQANTTSCPTSFAQKAAITALRGSQDCVTRMVKEYNKRRNLMVRKLNDIPGISCSMPKGAFYTFPDVSGLKKPSQWLVDKLLEEEGVSSTPGIAFGTFGEGHIRFSFSMSTETVIFDALEKLSNFVERLDLD